ncbi:hypothetical protein SEA_FENRY_30 [Gordonia phage Fenry]|nr:hypothetical protein SEA_FENRY_30 [Gordonia phage Fenry]
MTMVSSAATVLGGAAGGAMITRRASRVENARTWERDQVTERCVTLMRALHDLNTSVMERAFPAFQDSPVDPAKVADARVEVQQAYHRLSLASAEAALVARSHVMPLAAATTSIKPTVFIPHFRPQGIPVAAAGRMQRELEYCRQIESLLVMAIRADLGLLRRKERLFLKQKIQTFLVDVLPLPREIAPPGTGADALARALLDLQVMPIPGADPANQFAAPVALLRAYTDQLPALAGKADDDILSVLVVDGGELYFGSNADIDGGARTDGLFRTAYFIEHGFRGGTLEVRDLPSGALLQVAFRS